MGVLAKILVCGDIHLSSKKYGAHRDYPSESLECFKKITETAELVKATHIIGLGDFSYGRFSSLEYRLSVEKELDNQYKLVNGNRYEIMGNHDTATYGMTEYEYYIEKGYLRKSENLTIGNLNLSMIDSGKLFKQPIIAPDKDKINIVLFHDFIKFQDTRMAEYGNFYDIQELPNWFGVDYAIGGHIHQIEGFNGSIHAEKEGQTIGHELMVVYPGCMSRPSYREGHMDTVGKIVCLTVFDNGEIEFETINIDLLPLEESFNLGAISEKHEKKVEKERRVDISDVINDLATHERNIGNPEDIIQSITNVEDKYKNKAIDLLKAGLA